MARKVLVVSRPSELPAGKSHMDMVDALSVEHELVLLMKFGDERYEFSDNYILPHNVKLLEYDWDTIDQSINTLAEYLRGLGVGLISRHHADQVLPFVIAGSILSVPPGVSLDFFSKHRYDVQEAQAIELSSEPSEWDL